MSGLNFIVGESDYQALIHPWLKMVPFYFITHGYILYKGRGREEVFMN